MMAAYQLKAIPARFYTTTLDVLALAEQLGDVGLLHTLMQRPYINGSLAGCWGTVTDQWAPQSPTSCERPDISLWDTGCLLLNQKAYSARHQALAADGEFLPITVDGEPMQVFNCMTWGKEDMSLTEKAYLDGYEDGIATLAFDEADIAGKMVFKSQLEAGARLYVSAAFKELVETHQLQGLRFDPELMDPF